MVQLPSAAPTGGTEAAPPGNSCHYGELWVAFSRQNAWHWNSRLAAQAPCGTWFGQAVNGCLYTNKPGAQTCTLPPPACQASRASLMASSLGWTGVGRGQGLGDVLAGVQKGRQTWGL